MPKDGMDKETSSGRGWKGVGGGGCTLKIVIVRLQIRTRKNMYICIAKGGKLQFSYVITLRGEGGDLIHHTFLKTPAPHWDVINERSLTISHCSQSPGSDS